MLVLLNINGIAKLTVICDSPNWLAFIVDNLYNAKLFRNNGTRYNRKKYQDKTACIYILHSTNLINLAAAIEQYRIKSKEIIRDH